MRQHTRKIAYIFPGQGAQEPGMGLALAQVYAPAQQLLAQASELLGEDLPRRLQRGGRRLQDADVLQAAISAVSLGAWLRLHEAGLRPTVVAGHSLGELAAWCAAGSISPKDTLALAVSRGAAMAQAARQHPGGLLALTRTDRAQVDAALACGQAHGAVGIAAYNGPQEWVLSGEEAAIQAVQQAFSATRIDTSGPWHSPLMQPAYDAFLPVLQALPYTPTQAAFVANHTGTRVASDADIPALLAEQLRHPIRWCQCVQSMQDLGVTDYVAIGLVPTLRSLLRQNLPVGATIHAASSPQELDATLARLCH